MANETKMNAWVVNGSESSTAIWVEDAETGKRVCTVRNCDNDLDVARLIAAATDMFEALEEMIRCHAEPSGPHSGNIVTGDMRRAANERARSALKSARGEE